MSVHHGGCHCGAVAFEVSGDPDTIYACNCSICSMRAYLHWIVPPERFRLLTPWTALETYTFNTGVARHYFCRICGIHSFYVPRSHPDQFSVNARCVAGLDLDACTIEPFDGRNWERARETLRE